MKATKGKKELKASAKNTAKKYFADLREDMLFGKELYEFVKASVIWEKDEGFHVEEYYEYICEELMEIYFRIYKTCSCCYNHFLKKDMTTHEGKEYCLECFNKNFEAKKKDVKTEKNNNITRFNETFGEYYEILTKKDPVKITQNMYLKIRCKRCNTVFIKKLANVFRVEIKDEPTLCSCKGTHGRKNILANSKRAQELELEEKRERARKLKRAQRRRKKEQLKKQQEKLKKELREI